MSSLAKVGSPNLTATSVADPALPLPALPSPASTGHPLLDLQNEPKAPSHNGQPLSPTSLAEGLRQPSTPLSCGPNFSSVPGSPPITLESLSPVREAELVALKNHDVHEEGGLVKQVWREYPKNAVLRQLGYAHALAKKYGVQLTPVQEKQLEMINHFLNIDKGRDTVVQTKSWIENIFRLQSGPLGGLSTFDRMLSAGQAVVKSTEKETKSEIAYLPTLILALPSDNPLIPIANAYITATL